MNVHLEKPLPRSWILAVVAAIGVTIASPQLARTSALDSADSAAPTVMELPLRWNFQVGDMFRIREKACTLLTDEMHNRYRNETQWVYVWQVADVAPDGSATLTVTPERVTIHSQLPLVEFDSEADDPTVALVESEPWRGQLFEARAWTHAEFQCEVTAEGRVLRIWGAIPHSETRTPTSFTPGDFVTLPGSVMQGGDSWQIEVNGENRVTPEGAGIYRLTECKRHSGQPVWHIEGTVESPDQLGGPIRQSAFGPTISVSHFDVVAGRFLDQVTVTSGQVQIAPHEAMTVRVGTMRQLTPMPEPRDVQPRNGEYVFVGQGDVFRPVQLAGTPVDDTKLEPLSGQQELRIVFHHGLDDLQPATDELTQLKNVTNRFSELEPVRAVLTKTGTDECQVRVDVRDSQGQHVSTYDLPVTAGARRIARLQTERLAAGVYFFEWYVNERYLVRVPVLVFPDPNIGADKPVNRDLADERNSISECQRPEDRGGLLNRCGQSEGGPRRRLHR